MAVTYTPTGPISGDTISLSSTGLPGTQFRVFALTSKPSKSTLTLSFLLSPGKAATFKSALAVLEGARNSSTFRPDVAGEYGIRAYSYWQGVGVPKFPGDPAGSLDYHFMGFEDGTVYVASVDELPIITTAGDGATLRLTVTNETISTATLINPTTETARIAALDSTVTAALTALVGVSTSAFATNLQVGVNDLRAKFEGHRANTGGSFHNVSDTTNAVSRQAVNSQQAAVALLNELRERIVGHLSTGSGSTFWHQVSDVKADDAKNVPAVGSAATLGQATVLLADLRERVYERHRVQTASPAPHGASDTTNALTAPSLLDNLIVALIDAIVTASPNAAAGEPEGSVDLAHGFGFRSR